VSARKSTTATPDHIEEACHELAKIEDLVRTVQRAANSTYTDHEETLASIETCAELICEKLDQVARRLSERARAVR